MKNTVKAALFLPRQLLRLAKYLLADRESKLYERMEPNLPDERTVLEHIRRYTLASNWVQNKVVLDLACGEGYGSSMLAARAKEVIGIDLCKETIAAATRKYAKNHLTFEVGSMTHFPFNGGKTFDVIVCFEALEHIQEHEECFSEIKRHLKPGGLLILSTPNRPVYSPPGGNQNPFHFKELDYEELQTLFGRYFRHFQCFGQQTYLFSNIYPLDGSPNCFLDDVLKDPHPPYFFCLGSDEVIQIEKNYHPDPRFPDWMPPPAPPQTNKAKLRERLSKWKKSFLKSQ